MMWHQWPLWLLWGSMVLLCGLAWRLCQVSQKHWWDTAWMPLMICGVWCQGLIASAALGPARQQVSTLGLVSSFGLTLLGLSLVTSMRRHAQGRWPTAMGYTLAWLGPMIALWFDGTQGRLPPSVVLASLCLGTVAATRLHSPQRGLRLSLAQWYMQAIAQPLLLALTMHWHGLLDAPVGVAELFRLSTETAAWRAWYVTAPALATMVVYSSMRRAQRVWSFRAGVQMAYPADLMQALTQQHLQKLRQERAADECLSDVVMRAAQVQFWQFDLRTETLNFQQALMDDNGVSYMEDRIPMSQWMQEHVHPQDGLKVRKRMQEQLSDGQPMDVTCRIKRDADQADWRWMHCKGVIVQRNRTGRPLLLSGTLTDVHELEQAKLARMADAAVFSAGPVVMMRWTLDTDSGEINRLDFASANVQGLWGHPHDLVVQPTSKPIYLDVNALTNLNRSLHHALHSGQSQLKMNLEITFADQRKVWHQLDGRVEVEADGTHLDAFLLNVDGFLRARQEASTQQAELQSLLSRLDATRKEGSIVQESSEMLNACTSLAEAGTIVTHALVRLLPQWGGWMTVKHPGTELMDRVTQWGLPEDAPHDLAANHCWALRRGKMHCCSRPGLDLACRHNAPRWAQRVPSLCLPMIANGRTIGSLHLVAHDYLSEEQVLADAAIAQRVADASKLAVYNLMLQNELGLLAN
ncbi:MAG: Signal transduction histidine kinase [Pseudomonadota bacterium]|jgi:PAS domain-containing protein